ncbi:MAG: hypothetical protein FWE04_05865 [Oscillospiraceae bacterium]|nr:hypothetical protein [Oscillospiraceae bacterium]
MFIAIGIIGILVGLTCMLVKKDTLINMFKNANQQKGTEVYSDENIAKRIKILRIIGPIGILAGIFLIVTEFIW